MATNYSPAIVTDGAVFVGDALMPSTATSATKLYNRAGSSDGTMYAGTCFDFDGTDDVVTTSDPIITGTGDFTFTAYINRTTVNTFDYICGNYGTGNNTGVEFYGLNNGKINCYISGHVNSSSTLAAGTWYHVGVTRSAGVVQLYINGVADGAAVTRASSIGGSNNFTIGNGEDYTSENMDGKIADVKVFDVALSAANMKELYDNSKVIIPSNISQTNLKGWWSLAEGAGAICYDGSGNGYHGTATNTDGDEWLTGQTGAPQLIQGYNRPMLLDGSTDYVSIADSASLSVGSTFTISYWFYPEAITTEAYHVSKNTYSGNQKSYAALNNSSGKTQFRISGDGSSHIECTGSTTMSNKTWHHIVHVFDGSAGTKLKGWVDGTAQTFNQQPNVTGPYDSTSILCLGTRDAGLVAPLKGTINEVIIYNSALSDANATALFATGPNGGPLPPDPLSMSTSGDIVGYWRNDSNVTLTDLSGNSNTGTAVGSPSALLFKEGYNGNKNVNTGRDHQGFPLLYENNGAVGFNGGVGTGEYIDLGTCPTIFEMAQTSKTTILAWIKVGKQSGENGIISAFSTTAASGWSLVTYHASYNKAVSMLVSDGADSSAYWVQQAGTKLPEITADGKFHHVAVTISRISGTTTVYFYQDNVKNTTAKVFSNEGGSTAWGNGRQLIIGRGAAGWGDFHGQIGNVQIYKRILSDSEIQQNYNAQKSRFI